MRLFIFAILVAAFVAVAPQNEERTRPRGLRRFSLSSPALRAAQTTEDKGANELIEENHTAPVAPSEPRTRSRGTNTLRRGRPALRVRGRVNDQVQEATAPLASDNTNTKSVFPETGEGQRGGLRIRRPVKKLVATTTSTTTTTELPVAEEIATEPIQEEQLPLTLNKHETGKAGQGMLTEESNAVIKDEMMKNEEQKLMSEKMENLPAEEKPMQKEVIPEPKTEKMPQMKKLRPIPIKIRLRGKVQKSQPEDSPKEVIHSEPEQQQGSEDPKPVSSHRFSPRQRPRLQARRRPINRESTGAEAPQEAVGSIVAEENIQPESAARQQSRGDVPSLRRRPSRISTRQRTTEVQETQPQGTAVEETALPEFQPETRTTEINQMKKPLQETGRIDGSVKKRIKVRTRIHKPSTADEAKINQVTKEQIVDTLDSVLGAPISESVKAGRPSTRNEAAETEQVSQQERTESSRSKFRTPNYGGSDLIFKGGEVQVTQIGTIEDTPIEEVHKILSGFGTRRRGLARPRNSQPKDEVKPRTTNVQVNSQVREKPAEDSLTAPSNDDLISNVDFIYDYYEY